MMKFRILGFLLLLISPLTTFAIVPQSELLSYLQESRKNLLNMAEQLESCQIPQGIEADYNATFVSAVYRGKLSPGEKFKIKVYLTNTGNMPWYGDSSLCHKTNYFRLGTDKERDRESPLWENLVFLDNKLSKNNAERMAEGWLSGNRIRMKQALVLPGELATFEFYGVAPMEQDIYYENFKPVIEGITWMEDVEIPMRFHVGEITQEQRAKTKFMTFSGHTNELDLSQKHIRISITEQMLYAYMGDKLIYKFRVSTGAYDTPTPITKTQVYRKQEVRVGSKPPYYIMPYYHSLWPSGAFGFHALPSLANDGGGFWHEALTHIGRRVSHGCIRLLPDDVVTLWEFTEIGTPVDIRW